jgi:RimJ/RimL family protein N-acetyltransferase
MNIRPLEIDDFAAFLDIQREALVQAPEVFGSDYDWFEGLSMLSKEQRFERYLNYPYQYMLGAVDDSDRIIAMIGYSGNETSKLRHKSRIWGLYVRSEARGKGLATSLVQSVLDTARDVLGVEQVQLAVSTQNNATYGLYLRLGFTVYGTEVGAMKIGTSYVDEYLMSKHLV